MKCEVHSSDLDVFINALKRVTDDVRSIPDEKGKYSTLQALFDQCMIITWNQANYQSINSFSFSPVNITVPWFPRQIKDLDRCNLLITKFDPNMDQDHPVGVYICAAQYLSNIRTKYSRFMVILSFFCLFSQGYSDPEYRQRRTFIAELAFTYKQWVPDLKIYLHVTLNIIQTVISFVTGATSCPWWSIQQKKCQHGENRV